MMMMMIHLDKSCFPFLLCQPFHGFWRRRKRRGEPGNEIVASDGRSRVNKAVKGREEKNENASHNSGGTDDLRSKRTKKTKRNSPFSTLQLLSSLFILPSVRISGAEERAIFPFPLQTFNLFRLLFPFSQSFPLPPLSLSLSLNIPLMLSVFFPLSHLMTRCFFAHFEIGRRESAMKERRSPSRLLFSASLLSDVMWTKVARSLIDKLNQKGKIGSRRHDFPFGV